MGEGKEGGERGKGGGERERLHNTMFVLIQLHKAVY